MSKILYIECGMGAAGDMLTAALCELLDEPDAFIHELNHIGLPDICVSRTMAMKHGISGSHISVVIGGVEESWDGDHHDHPHPHDHVHPHTHNDGHTHTHPHDHTHDHDHAHDHDHDHHHDHAHDHHHDHAHHDHHRDARGMAEIRAIIGNLRISDRVKADAIAVYERIAAAESKVHNKTVTEIHFHEVGAMDAIADIVAVCMLMEKLAADSIIVSPIHVGSGYTKCAHGMIPVPAPATALLLRDIPIYSGDIRGELCTPTGAALLAHFADSFGSMPPLAIQKTGYGMGNKDFERPNCVRAFLGTTAAESAANGTAVELQCNVDDVTPEALGYVSALLMDSGALDFAVTPAYMKKNRPGFILTLICKDADADRMAALLLQHTTTIGVRRFDCRRYTLARSFKTIETTFGPVQVKYSEGYGAKHAKPEYNDIAAIAAEKNLPFAEVYDWVLREIKL